MGKIKELVIPVEAILEDILENKPKKVSNGGCIDIVIPAICMAEKVVYNDPEHIVNVGKYKGRKVTFRSKFNNELLRDVYQDTPMKDHYTKVTRFTEIAGQPGHYKALTFYWCLIHKVKNGVDITRWKMPTKKE